MESIKIVHCIADLSADGAERVLLRLAKGMNSCRFKHHIVTLSGAGDLVDAYEKEGFRVESLGMKSLLSAPLPIMKLSKLISDIEPSIVQGWMYHGNLAASLAHNQKKHKSALLWNIRRCYYKEGNADKWLTNKLTRVSKFLSHKTDAIIYCAKLAAEQHETLGYDPSKRVVIPNGFDTDFFHPLAEGSDSPFRRELGIEASTPLVGIIGRYHPQKDYLTFAKAAKAVLDSMPEVRFVVIGRGVDSIDNELAKLIGKLGISEKVIRLAPRDNINEIIKEFDVYCSSSCNEGFPNVIAEAMSSAVPCVVTNAGASSEIVGDAGIVTDRYNPEKLAQGLIKLLSLQSQDRKQLGLKARRRIVENFTLDNMVSAYEELYEKLFEDICSNRNSKFQSLDSSDLTHSKTLNQTL